MLPSIASATNLGGASIGFLVRLYARLALSFLSCRRSVKKGSVSPGLIVRADQDAGHDHQPEEGGRVREMEGCDGGVEVRVDDDVAQADLHDEQEERK